MLPGQNIKRGDIVLVDLDPTVGAELKSVRPALIIQNDIGNKRSPTTIVAPITSQRLQKEYPTNVNIPKSGGLKTDSTVLLNQIRTADLSRIKKRLSTLDQFYIYEVNEAIKISLGL